MYIKCTLDLASFTGLLQLLCLSGCSKEYTEEEHIAIETVDYEEIMLVVAEYLELDMDYVKATCTL